MKCNKCKKLIHRMLNEDLTRQERREVCAHLETCEDCRSYYEDIAYLCAELQDPDPEPPADFRRKWKEQIAAAAQTTPARKRKMRPAVLVPVVACCVAAMFVVSTILVNPQAFGLEGRNVTGEWFAAIMPAVSAEPAAPVDQGPGQKVSFVAKSEQKPNLLGYEDAEYSETTTTSSAVPALSAEGTIEPQHNEILGTIQDADAMDANGRALPDETPLLTLSVAEEEKEHLRELAGELGVDVISDDDNGLVLEGPPEKIEEVASGHHLEMPADAELVRLHVS